MPVVYSRHEAGASMYFDTFLVKSVWEGNLYLGPFKIIERILESEIIFKFPVMT